MGDPSLAVRRYFLSQMSNDASWKVMLLTSLGCILTTVFMGIKNAPLELSREKHKTEGGGPIRQSRRLNQNVGRSASFETTTYCVQSRSVRPQAAHRQDIFRLFFVHINLYISVCYRYIARNYLITLYGISVKGPFP